MSYSPSNSDSQCFSLSRLILSMYSCLISYLPLSLSLNTHTYTLIKNKIQRHCLPLPAFVVSAQAWLTTSETWIQIQLYLSTWQVRSGGKLTQPFPYHYQEKPSTNHLLDISNCSSPFHFLESPQNKLLAHEFLPQSRLLEEPKVGHKANSSLTLLSATSVLPSSFLN